MYQGVDLAISKSDEACYFVICTVGTDTDGNIYLLDVFRDKLDFMQQTKAIIRKWREYRPNIIAVETNAYQEALPQFLQNDPVGKVLPIKPIKSQGDKSRRITSLAPLFEMGNIRVKEDMTDFITEYLGFPRGFVDQLDALHMAIEASQAYRTESRISFVEV